MSATSQADPPAVAESGTHRHLGWALFLICIAQLMVVLDATIANIALPFIQDDLDFSQSNLTWIVTGYALAFGGFLLLGGRLGDLLGRRRTFIIGLSIFAIASLIGGFAPNEGILLGARGLQGIGAALASPAALALITTTFPAGPARTRAFGIYAAMSGAGAAVGLILGGWLTGLHDLPVEGWRLTFLINVPIGLAAAFFAPRLLAESDRHEARLDIPGALTGTLGLLGIVFGLSRAGESAYGWGNWQTLTALIAGVVLLVAFVVIETRIKEPLLPMRVFASQSRAASFVAFMIAPAAMFAMFFYLSQFVQIIMGFSPLQTGVAFLPFSVGIIVGATLTQSLVHRISPRIIVGVGTLLATVALFGFSRIDVDDSGTGILSAISKGQDIGHDVNYWSHLFPFVVIMAIGMGMVFVTLTLTAVHGLKEEDQGIGSGVLNTMQQVGGALGLAILTTVGTHFVNSHADKIAGALQQGGTAAGLPADQVQGLIQLGSFPEGAVHGFLVGAVMMLVASLVIWAFLNVSKEELAADESAEGGVVMH